jgi:hypothetical protein
MSSTPTIKAVTNGTSTSDTSAADDRIPQRTSGLAHVWEQQVYHTASLGESALMEAEQLLRKIQQISSYTHRRESAQPLDMDDVGSSLREALDCIDVAMEHLSALSVAIRSRMGEDITSGPLF